MGLSRRFLNLILETWDPSAKSLRRIDLSRRPFFYPTPPPPIGSVSESPDAGKKTAAPAAELKMDRIRLPSPSFNLRAAPASTLHDPWRIDCFPLVDRKVVCTDHSGRAFLLDAYTRDTVTMPNLLKPKQMLFYLFVPSADADDHSGGGGGSLFVMERIPKPEWSHSEQQSGQFEAFVYGNPNVPSESKSWFWHLLPPPPFVRESSNGSCSEITSYAVVGSGICISTERAGTYHLDTASHTWSKLGEWSLPFYGQVEYVPELKLWFGLSAKVRVLAAADLSAMDSRPQLVGSWKELDPPEEWQEYFGCRFVHLGSGRFCIARCFTINNGRPNGYIGEEVVVDNFTVLTGVEVVQRVHGDKHAGNCGGGGGDGGNGKVKLRMIKHKSRRLRNTNGVIAAMF